MTLYLQSSNMPSWHGAQFKRRDNFTLPKVSTTNSENNVIIGLVVIIFNNGDVFSLFNNVV